MAIKTTQVNTIDILSSVLVLVGLLALSPCAFLWGGVRAVKLFWEFYVMRTVSYMR